MDPKVAEMRRQAAERYRRAPASEKPTIRMCADCEAPVYDSKVCPATGKLHDREKYVTVGGKLVDSSKRTISGGELMEAINEVRIRWQPARVGCAKVDGDSIGIFQSFVLARRWQLMRFGILYGTVSADSPTIVSVDAIYEPEQVGSVMDFSEAPDPRLEKVDAIAKALGLRRVGICCSHQPRDQNTIVVTAKELLLLAREQSIHGDHCILITVGPSSTTNEIEAQAWQASQQCIHLFQLGFFSESSEDIRFIHSSEALEIAQDSSDEKGHKKCVIKEPSNSVDTRWMIAPVAVERFQSLAIRNTFARISRPGETPPTLANLRNYLQDPKRKRLPFIEAIADFHVLVFLAEDLFGPRDMEVILGAVQTKNSQAVAVYEDMLRDHFKAMGN